MSKRKRYITQNIAKPTKSNTLVDVIIPVMGRFDLLEQCLQALPEAFGDISYKVYIWDNASPDQKEADEFYENHKNATIARSKENVGFPRACNLTFIRGMSPLVFFLNSDVILDAGSMAHLVSAMDEPTVGVAGMKLIFPEHTDLPQDENQRPAGKIQHVGISTNIRAEVFHQFLGWSENNPRVKAMHDVYAVTGAALMTRRWLFQEAGKFNEVYGRGCLSGDTYVFTDKGIEVLSSFFPNDAIELRNIDVNIISEDKEEKATLAYNNGIQSTLKVKLEKDFQIHGTYNHKVRFMNENGVIDWKQLDELKIGDFVPVRYGMKSFGTNSISDDLAYFLGLYLAEGSCEKKKRITITTGDKEIQKFLVEKFDFTSYNNNNLHWRKGGIDFCNLINAYVDLNKKAFTKELSPFLMQMSEQSTISLLQGMFDGDGSAIKDGRVNYSTSSYKLAKQVQLILLNFGIVSGIYPRTSNLGRVNYLIDFGSYSGLFYDLIGFRLERKQKNKEFVRYSLSPSIPYQRKHFKSLYSSLPKGERNNKIFSGHSVNDSQGVRKDTIDLLLKHVYGKDVNVLTNEDCNFLVSATCYDWYWLKVKSIEDGGEIQTYDLHVPETHTYIADGVVVHNTYEDIDFCLTVRKMGYNVVVVPEARGIHHTGATAVAYQISYPLNENRVIFLQKWQKDLDWTEFRHW